MNTVGLWVPRVWDFECTMTMAVSDNLQRLRQQVEDRFDLYLRGLASWSGQATG